MGRSIGWLVWGFREPPAIERVWEVKGPEDEVAASLGVWG
jgi:hypothetical protein